MIVFNLFQVLSRGLTVTNIVQEFVFQRGLPIRFCIIFVNLDEEDNNDDSKVKVYEILYLYQFLLKEYILQWLCYI